MNAAAAKIVEILLAEDEEADIELVKQATKNFKIINKLHVVRNGVELLQFLRNEGPYKSAPKPDLILLDLNMPKMSGIEALEQIRQDPSLTHLPVVMMTSSTNESDVLKSYKLHVNCFVVKPLQLAEFEKVVNSIEQFWFSIVQLPVNK